MMAQMSFRDFFIGLFSSWLNKLSTWFSSTSSLEILRKSLVSTTVKCFYLWNSDRRTLHSLDFLWQSLDVWQSLHPTRRIWTPPPHACEPTFSTYLWTNPATRNRNNPHRYLLALAQASKELGMEWSLGKLALLIFIAICIGLLYAAIQLGPTALAFWIVESFLWLWEFSPQSDGSIPTQYLSKNHSNPADICFPYAFTAYFPALYFLDLSMWGLALPLVVLVLFAINYKLFRYGMTKFTSVGN